MRSGIALATVCLVLGACTTEESESARSVGTVQLPLTATGSTGTA